MTPKASPAYLDARLQSGQYEDLAELSRLLSTADSFHLSADDYGLAMPLFVFIESMSWFAQAIRSGTWTYFEATSTARQAAMYKALESLAPTNFAKSYALGMSEWRNPDAMQHLDRWIEEHDTENNRWLSQLAQSHRSEWSQALA